jgi:hypothetical protein
MDGKEQGRHPLPVGGIHVRLMVQEQVQERDMVVEGRHVHGSAHVTVDSVHVGASGEKDLANAHVPPHGRRQKGCPIRNGVTRFHNGSKFEATGFCQINYHTIVSFRHCTMNPSGLSFTLAHGVCFFSLMQVCEL